MGILWYSYGISIGFPYDFYGISMMFLWISLGFLWDSYGIPMGVPSWFYDIPLWDV